MISSSSPPLARGLDTMLLVYSLLRGHPAAAPCEHFIRTQPSWFTSPLVLVEAKNVLTKVYSVDSGTATQKLMQFVGGPITLLDLDQSVTTAAFHLADVHGLDLTDAVLLCLADQHGVRSLATEDQRLTKACS
jgi:predicted nucleic acid-binding protein